MSNSQLNEFAKLLVQHVRDVAIRNCKLQLTPEMTSPVAKRWRETVETCGQKGAIETAIPDCVDETIFCLLQAIDQGLLQLSYTAANGVAINLPEDGLAELSGWYMGSSGWRAMYSTETVIDDFSDLT